MKAPKTVFNKSELTYSQPRIMGIINTTPDSFFDGGRHKNMKDILKNTEEMILNNADIIDVGGESSRPGSQQISEKEEMNRVIPVIKEIKKKFNNVYISIDTYKSVIAQAAIDEGADIINDISSFSLDGLMLNTIIKNNIPLVIMHMKGTPGSMQDNPVYNDVVKEVFTFFKLKINVLFEKGFSKEKIIIDPGIGFGKTMEHNIALLKNINYFRSLGTPVLIGTSMKSIIGDITGRNINERLAGTIGINLASIINGANIIRVHDVKSMNDSIKTFFSAWSN